MSIRPHAGRIRFRDEGPDYIAEVQRRYAYDPETGVFTSRSEKQFYAGKAVGHPNADGYVLLTLFKRKLLAHRAAFMVHLGRRPDGVVDHIDGDKTNNRFVNLRETRQSINTQNAVRSNASGLMGVYQYAPERWCVRIGRFRKPIHLGVFKDPLAAAQVYDQAALLMFGENAMTNERLGRIPEGAPSPVECRVVNDSVWPPRLEDALRRGLCIRRVAEELGLNHSSVSEAAKRHGVKLPDGRTLRSEPSDTRGAA